MACDHKTKVPLDYYYDDDWGHKGNQVWYNDPNQGGERKEGRLCMCIDCGQAFVVPHNTIDKD